MPFPSSLGLFSLFILCSCCWLLAVMASPLLAPKSLDGQTNQMAKAKTKKFWPESESPFPASARGWAGQPPLLLPYANGNGFISPFPSGLSDRWAGYLADEQFAGGASKRTEGHFMEPAGMLGLGEPGRFEWNFNRLR